MAKPTGYERPAWEDRFNRPTVARLREGLRPAAVRKLFDQLHRQLMSLEGVQADFAWQGVSWRWTIEYRIKRSEEPLAVVVPAPENLQLAVPFERELVRALPVKRMKRAVRDGLDLARDPFDTHWGVWSIVPGLLEDVVDLVEMKWAHLSSQVG